MKLKKRLPYNFWEESILLTIGIIASLATIFVLGVIIIAFPKLLLLIAPFIILWLGVVAFRYWRLP